MNRLFDTLFIGALALLGLFLLALMAGMLIELFRQSLATPPQMDEVAFAIRLSLITATISSVMAMVAAVPAAYILSRCSFFGKAFVDTLLDLPIVLSPIALGALLLIFFNSPLGSGLDQWLGPFVFEVRGIVVAQFLVVVGLAIRLLKATFDGIDVEYEHLARTLGYDKLRVFLRVTLPMASRGLVAAFLLVWGRAIGEFGATVMLAGATTMKTETIPVAIYLNFESADISSALVFIAILIALSFTVLLFVRRTKAYVR
ncbi:MAG: ABC transporter permease subunit [Planctomycetota bacterium]